MKPGNHSTVVVLLVLGATSIFSTFVAAQGSLTPTNAPAPTMKSLDQIEPRIDVLTLPSDANAVHAITKPGSYNLSGNFTVGPALNGISIETNNVTLDLNGFTVSGGSIVSNVSFGGIVVIAGFGNITICNGSLNNWYNGGVSAAGSANGELKGLKFIGNGLFGAQVGTNFIIENCEARDNMGIGISIVENCQVFNCISTGNAFGIESQVGSHNLIDRCNVRGNQSFGIFTVDNSIVENCIATGNGTGQNGTAGIAVSDQCIVRGCVANANSSAGITAGSRCRIEHCEVQNNFNDGILVNSDCIILENHSSNNTNGVHSVGSGNRIEGNQASNNRGFGIRSDNSGVDVTIRNSAKANAAGNYSPASGTTFGPIQNPATQTSPVANVSF